MAFGIFYNTVDSQRIQDCYQASRTALANNDRQNIDAVWTAGLSQWGSATNRVYSAGPPETWVSQCLNPDGTPNLGLCDKDTHLIAISGTWARSVAPYATSGQPITKAGFVTLMQKLGNADPDQVRGQWIVGLATDIANTAVEPL